MQHAIRSASSTSRWMNCPGSIRLIVDNDLHKRSSTNIFAREGTCAHDLAEMALKKGLFEADSFAGLKLSEEFSATPDMIKSVNLYLDYVRQRVEATKGTLYVEQQVSLNRYVENPESRFGPIFGTSDAVIVSEDGTHLEVIDLKYGRAVVVEAKENTQLMTYGLGSILKFGLLRTVKTVALTIVQPRGQHAEGPIRSWNTDRKTMAKFAGRFRRAVAATEHPNATLTAGSHCRWCPAAAVCPRLHAQVIEAAKTDFADVQAEEDEELARRMAQMPMIDAYVRGLKDEAESRLLSQGGGEAPFGKLVRANKRAVFPETAVPELLELGLSEEDLYTSSKRLKTPAQVAKGMPEAARDLIYALAVKPQGELIFADRLDPRKAEKI